MHDCDRSEMMYMMVAHQRGCTVGHAQRGQLRLLSRHRVMNCPGLAGCRRSSSGGWLRKKPQKVTALASCKADANSKGKDKLTSSKR